MPRFDFNPTEATAGFPVFDKGEYELVLGEAKPFYGQGKNGKADNHGVMFMCKIAEGEQKGKKYTLRCYQHNQESRDYSKQVQMAVLGFDKSQETAFNEEFGIKDWTYNTDDNSVGEGWQAMSGHSVMFTLDKTIDDKGDPQQKTLSMRPFRP